MNNEPVVVSCGAKNRNTDELTIAKKTLTVTGASHTKQYDGQLTANTAGFSGVTFTGRILVNGIRETVTYESVTGNYTNKNAGTVGMIITSVELAAGESYNNYTVTTPSANFDATGGITQRTITIVGATHTKPYDGNATVTGGLSNLVFSNNVDTVNYGSVTAQYTGTNAGTNTIEITAITLTGDSLTNYNVTLPAFVTVAGILRLAATVTAWPTAAAINYGSTLSGTQQLSGGSATANGQALPGTFTWTSNTTPSSAGIHQYSVTFTPTNPNYDTVSSNVSITVNPRVTFNMNGGTYNNSTNDYITYVTYDDHINPNNNQPSANPTRTSYTFGGWYTDAALTIPYNWSDIGLGKITSNITIYAEWVSNTTVTQIQNNSNMNMVFVPAGYLTVGTYGDGRTSTDVISTVLSAFYIGKYEVTQAQFQSVMNKNPSYFQGASYPPASGDTQTKRPVESVTWFDAVEFCNTLSANEGLQQVYTFNGNITRTNSTSGGSGSVSKITAVSGGVTADWTKNGYRLLTQAEWEYAARRGVTSMANAVYAGNGGKTALGWVDCNPAITHEIGKKNANPLGTYDQTGNVHEWVWDWNSSFYYANGGFNYRGESSGTERIYKGGGFNGGSDNVSYRPGNTPQTYTNYIGFRVARNVN